MLRILFIFMGGRRVGGGGGGGGGVGVVGGGAVEDSVHLYAPPLFFYKNFVLSRGPIYQLIILYSKTLFSYSANCPYTNAFKDMSHFPLRHLVYPVLW